MAAGGHEREYKFAVPAEWAVPPLDDLCVADTETAAEQTATYYDTPDLRLTRAGASLRYRSDDGWTVKLPVDDHAHGMLVRAEHVFGGTAAVPPAAALELVAARVRTARLAPVARLHTLRRSITLRTAAPRGDVAAGHPLGVLTDDQCTVLEGFQREQFHEVEFELADDAPGDLVDAVAHRLREAGARDTSDTPKVKRALGPAATAPPDVVSYPVDTPATVEAVIRHALSDAVCKLVVSDPVVRIGEDIEGVHQARVATRRLRSHLRTFRAQLEPAWAEELRTELGWLGTELGAVRDADVLLDRLQRRVADLDEPDRAAAQPLLDRLGGQQCAARVVLLEGMRSPRYLQLLDRLVEAAHRPQVVMRVAGNDDAELRALVRRPWRQLRTAVAALPDPAPDPALHAVRIRAKRARYATEVVEPAFGSPARDLAKALARVQDVLGEHQDAVIAGAWLRATALTLSDPAAVYAAGELGAAERTAAEVSRAAWPAAWKAVGHKRLRGWL
ncbi:MAG: CYTH and CHAD domain-containing protein [Acidimicrobiia bacterium]|jgi:CHAD domain-containing protein